MEPKKGPPVKVKFVRNISLFDAVMVGIGGIVGGSIFALAGIALFHAGPALILVFVFNALIMLMTAFSYAELGSMLKEAGGGYRPVDISMPPPFGFLAGWMAWFARTVACALYIITFGTFAVALPPVRDLFAAIGTDLAVKVLSFSAAAVLILINYIGTSMSKRTENILTILQLVIMGIFIAGGALYGAASPSAAGNFQPFFGAGTTGIILAMGLLYVAFEGSELITTLGEEIREPEKNIPRAIFISLGTVVILYVLLITAAIATLPWQTLANAREHAIIFSGETAMGIFGIYLIIVVGAVSTLSGFNSALMASSRVAFAMGRRGHLPGSLGTLHRKSKSPANAVLFSGSIIMFMILILPLETIAASTSLLFMLTFILVNLSLILLRSKDPDAKRGFRVPLYPLPPLIAIAANVIIAGYLFTLDQVAWYIAILWIEVGLVAYYVSRGKREAVEAVKAVAPEAVPEVRGPVVSVVSFTKSLSKFTRVGELAAESAGYPLHLMDIITISRLVSPADVNQSVIKKHARRLESMCRACTYQDVEYEVVITSDPVDGVLSEIKEHKVAIQVLIAEKDMPPKEAWRWITSLSARRSLDRILVFGEPKKRAKSICIVLAAQTWNESLRALMESTLEGEKVEVSILDMSGGGASKLSDELQIAGIASSIVDIDTHRPMLPQVHKAISGSDIVLFIASSSLAAGLDMGPRLDPKVEVLIRAVMGSAMILYIPGEKRKGPASESDPAIDE